MDSVALLRLLSKCVRYLPAAVVKSITSGVGANSESSTHAPAEASADDAEGVKRFFVCCFLVMDGHADLSALYDWVEWCVERDGEAARAHPLSSLRALSRPLFALCFAFVTKKKAAVSLTDVARMIADFRAPARQAVAADLLHLVVEVAGTGRCHASEDSDWLTGHDSRRGTNANVRARSVAYAGVAEGARAVAEGMVECRLVGEMAVLAACLGDILAKVQIAGQESSVNGGDDSLYPRAEERIRTLCELMWAYASKVERGGPSVQRLMSWSLIH